MLLDPGFEAYELELEELDELDEDDDDEEDPPAVRRNASKKHAPVFVHEGRFALDHNEVRIGFSLGGKFALGFELEGTEPSPSGNLRFLSPQTLDDILTRSCS